VLGHRWGPGRDMGMLLGCLGGMGAFRVGKRFCVEGCFGRASSWAVYKKIDSSVVKGMQA
jgi:hypothetical protein